MGLGLQQGNSKGKESSADGVFNYSGIGIGFGQVLYIDCSAGSYIRSINISMTGMVGGGGGSMHFRTNQRDVGSDAAGAAA